GTNQTNLSAEADNSTLDWEAQGDTADEKIAARRDIVRQLVQRGWDKADIADALSVSRKTVNRDIASLNGTLLAVAN
ncbi:MAG: HTH domain-containing protein, partial [Anaerolineales bacterium]|nr:HTH domain-containing protein [Anaerolineales bacterium]